MRLSSNQFLCACVGPRVFLRQFRNRRTGRLTMLALAFPPSPSFPVNRIRELAAEVPAAPIFAPQH